MQQFLQIVQSGVVIGSIYAIAALGFTIVFNATRIANFAHGEFVMMGGLISAVLISSYGLSTFVAVPVSTALVCVLGVLLDRVALQRARRKTELTLVMITIGAGITFRGLMQIVVGRDVYFMPEYGVLPSIQFDGVGLSSQAIWIALTLTVVTVGLRVLFSSTQLGKAMRAASENPLAAALQAIDPSRMSSLAFLIASGTGALAGALITPLASASYESGLFYGLKGFSAAILGGLGNPIGAIVGGIIIGLAESISAGYLSSSFKDAVALVLLLTLLLVRPSGLLGHVEVKRV